MSTADRRHFSGKDAMPECEHRPEWRRQRPNKDFYCTVCRAVIAEQITIFPKDQVRSRSWLRRRLPPVTEFDDEEQGGID